MLRAHRRFQLAQRLRAGTIWEEHPSGLHIALATALGILMLVAGILAFVLASQAMSATLVAAMVALWLMAPAGTR
jgi:hypothetical protein